MSAPEAPILAFNEELTTVASDADIVHVPLKNGESLATARHSGSVAITAVLEEGVSHTFVCDLERARAVGVTHEGILMRAGKEHLEGPLSVTSLLARRPGGLKYAAYMHGGANRKTA